MLDIYGSRSKAVVPKVGGHPFTNLFREDDLSADNPVFRFALSPAVLDAALDTNPIATDDRQTL